VASPYFRSYEKDPGATLDYVWNWRKLYLELGETIIDSLVSAQPGITLVSFTNSTDTVTAWLSGGTVGQEYLITSRITTSAGRVDERSILVRVEQR